MNPYAIKLQKYRDGTWAFPEFKIEARELTRAETKCLLEQLRKGDETARHALTEGNLRLALKLAGNAVHRDRDVLYYTTPEDVLGAALQGLVDGVNHVKPRPNMNSIASYAADYIGGAIEDEISWRPEGKEDDPPDQQLSKYEDLYDDRLGEEGYSFDEVLGLYDQSLDEREIMERLEVIHRACTWPHDFEILELKLAGHSFREIERQTGVPQSTARDRCWRLVRQIAEELGVRLRAKPATMPKAA